MAHRSKPFDYEPLTRPQRSTALEVEGFNSPAAKSRIAEFEARFEGRGTEASDGTQTKDQRPEPSKPSVKDVAKSTVRQRLVIKRGHAVSFVGLFLFTFVLYVRPYELFPSLTWLRGIAFWLAVATMAVYVPTQLGLDGKLTIRPREVNLIAMLLLAALLSVPLASDRQVSWDAFTDYLKVVVMFIVLVNVVRTERRLKWLFLLVLIVSCVLSVAAINHYRLGRLDSGGQRIKGIIGGMFDNPNDLALHLVTVIPIAVSLALGSRAGLKKLFYAVGAILLLAGVVATFSRGGFLGLACMGGVLGWRVARRNKWMVIMLAPLLLGGIILLAPGGYGSRMGTTSDESASARLDDLKRSIFIAVRHPLFGVGMGNYILYSNKEHASHNSYTQVASEMGLGALLIYVLFQVTAIKELRKIARESWANPVTLRYHYLAIGLEASLIGYMVASFFASVAFLWYVYYLVGYAICLRQLYAASAEPVLDR